VRAVIFDLDGTLVDTSGDLIAAANYCFRTLGFGNVLQPSKDAAVALRGGRMMLRHGLKRVSRYDELEVTRLYPILLDAYEQSIDTYSTFFPGALDAVKRLHRNGFAVGICTNKPERLAELLMTRLGARDLFDSLIGADTLSVCKPDPAPFFEAIRRANGDTDRACLVGDSRTDLDTARAAGASSILVNFGPSAVETVTLKPDAFLSDFADLPEIAAGLIPEHQDRGD